MRNRRPVVTCLSIAVAAGSLAFLASCSNDSPVVPSNPATVAMCRPVASPGISTVADVPLSDLAAHRARGEYVTQLIVDPATTSAADGIHYTRIGSALAAVRADRLARGETTTAACRITISVAAGDFRGASKLTSDPQLEQFPLIIDVPQVSLVGALHMQLDGNGRATATGTGTQQTALTPTTGMAPDVDAVIIVNGHADGSSAGNGAVIEGFVLRSGHVGVDADTGGFGVFAMRVRDLVIRGNRFEPALSDAIDVRSTSAVIANNYVSGGGPACDICAAGPGTFAISGNRVVSSGIDGIVVSAAAILPLPPSVEQYVAPAVAADTAVITNNEVRDHLRKPVGVGIRVAGIGLGVPNTAQSSIVDIRGNVLDHNTFGYLFEAGFPLVNTALKGDITLRMSGNTVTRSCQSDAFIAFTRHATALGVAQLTRPYVKNTTYQIDLGSDLQFANLWYAHKPDLGNSLVVNGVTIQPGSRMAYDSTKVCT